jgi:pimeloyl-ACP methyl ester carboxylesterase
MAEDVTFELPSGLSLHGLRWGSAGAKHLVLMLHGCGANAAYFAPLGERLADALGSGADLVAIDQRGYGESDKPATGYGPADYASDVLALREMLRPDRFTLIGHSRGGWQAAYVAGHYPQLVDSLVLLDPARLRFEDLSAAQAFYGRVRNGLGPFADRAAALRHAQNADSEARWWPPREEAFFAGITTAEDGTLVGKLPHHVLDELQEVRLQDDVVTPVLGDITARTLIFVAGKSDEKRQDQKLAYARGIAGTRVITLDTTHYIHHDRADDVAAAVAGFLDEVQLQPIV